MSQPLAKLIDRLFQKMAALCLTRIEASLDLLIVESCHELQQDLDRLESVGAPTSHLRLALERIAQVAVSGGSSPVEPAIAASNKVAVTPSKPKASSSSTKRGPGRPRKPDSTQAPSSEGLAAESSLNNSPPLFDLEEK